MDVTERLRTLLRPCSWVRDSATALRLVPELAVDIPSPLEIVAADGAGERAIPVRCLEPLEEPVAAVVLQLGAAALDGKPREELHKAGADRILADPLVPVVAGLLSQAAGPGLSAQGVPALSVAWLSGRMLSAGAPELRDRKPELHGRLSKLLTRLAELPPQRRGLVLSDITWGIRGRLAAAVSLAQAGGFTVEAGGLYRRVMADPLLLAFPRGTLDESIPFGVLAVMLGLPLEESLAGSIEKAAAAVLPALVDRRVRGKATPTDDALASAFAADLAAAPNARGVLFDLWSGPLLIASLPDLADVRLLTRAGVSKEVAVALMRREVVRALAASWRDLVTALLGWDVMSSVVSKLLPVREEKGRWTGPTGRLTPHPRWDLLVPRPLLPPVKATVVAVSLSAARARVARVAADRGQPLLSGAADGAWARLVAENPVGVYALVGERGLGVFADPLEALAFARKARQALSGPGRVPVGYMGDPIELPPGVSAPVGIATGEIRGGTDGFAVWLDGPAVAEALALSGVGEPDVPQEVDPSGIRGAIAADDGLRSRGVVCSGAALSALIQGVRDQDVSVRTRGKGGNVGGVGEEFSFYPIHTWWQATDGTVVAALALAGPNGPSELLFQARGAFSALSEADAELARTQQGRKQKAPQPFGGFGGRPAEGQAEAVSGQRADPFGSPGDQAADPFAQTDPFGLSLSRLEPARPEPARPEPARPEPARPEPARPEPARPEPARPEPARPAAHLAPAPSPPRPAAESAPKAGAAKSDHLGGFGAMFGEGSDPFADFDTEPGRAPAAPRSTPAAPAWAAPITPPTAAAPSRPAEAPRPAAPAAPADDPVGLEFFEPLPDAGDLFSEAYDGPSVSIEEEGWGGESELEQDALNPGGLGFVSESLEAPETPVSRPSSSSDETWASDYLSGFDLPASQAESDEGFDLFAPAPPAQGGPVGRAENILELEAGKGSFGFSKGAAQHESDAEQVADRLTEVTGGALLEAGSVGFSLMDEEDAGGERAAEEPQGGLADAPITWGDVMPAPDGPGEADAADLGGIVAGVDLGFQQAPLLDAFPESDSSSAVMEAESDEEEPSGGLSFEDFPIVEADQDALADWETGAFHIEEPEDPPSRPSAPLAASMPPRSEPRPSRDERPPARESPAPPRPPASGPAPATPDFGYLFMGYVLFEERGEAVFGRPYGRLLVDAHAFPTSMGLENAYHAFLQAKVREGFVPRTDMTRPYPADQPGHKLDLSLLVRAYRAMV